jgi:CheY-like chemotaxis protein
MDARAVLVIDDNDATRDGLVKLLGLRGYRTIGAANGRDGLECLRRDPSIGLVVLDLSMPGTNGYWFRAQQRGDPAISHIPLLVFTGADAAQLDSATLAGTHVLHKPLGISQLLDAIASRCEKPGASAPAKPASVDATNADEMPTVILVIEDDRQHRELLDNFLTQAGYMVQAASNGLEGLQAARIRRPALILLDLHMPVMDGVAFRRHQLRDPEIASVPIVCVSGIDDAPKVAADLGAIQHVAKPVVLEQLLHIVKTSILAGR